MNHLFNIKTVHMLCDDVMVGFMSYLFCVTCVVEVVFSAKQITLISSHLESLFFLFVALIHSRKRTGVTNNINYGSVLFQVSQ